MYNIIEYIRYLNRLRSFAPKRYKNLFKEIFRNKCKSILEVGVYNGIHARQMIQTASIKFRTNKILYVGFDLFEEITDKFLKNEYAKKPSSMKKIELMLKKTGANIQLYKGDTKRTLKKKKKELDKFDFIFIDGGHSIETISSDWENVKQLMHKQTIVIFDDYFTNIPKKMENIGCQKLINNIDKKQYNVKLLKPIDKFKKEWGYIETRFVRVTKRQ